MKQDPALNAVVGHNLCIRCTDQRTDQNVVVQVEAEEQIRSSERLTAAAAAVVPVDRTAAAAVEAAGIHYLTVVAVVVAVMSVQRQE